MADRILLESGAPDGYQLEDGTGVLLNEVHVVQAGYLSRFGGLRRMGVVIAGGTSILRQMMQHHH